MRLLYSLVCIFCFSFFSNAQVTRLDVNEWAKKLTDPSDKSNEWWEPLNITLSKYEKKDALKFIDSLNGTPYSKETYFIARYNCLKTEWTYLKNVSAVNPNIIFNADSVKAVSKELMNIAMQKAYELDDDYLAAFVSNRYGKAMSGLGETDLAVMYIMNSAELYEAVKLEPKFSVYTVLGEMMWRIREFDKSIQYTKKGLYIMLNSDKNENSYYAMMANNTLGLAYNSLGQYDSALKYYQQGIELEKKANLPIWKSFISGNIGQTYYLQGKYKEALEFLDYNYTFSKQAQIYDDAASALQLIAQINLNEGRTEQALAQVREVFALLQLAPANSVLSSTSNTAAQIFKKLGNNDSAYFYSYRYSKLHDSLEKVIYQSSLSISKLRLNNERNKYDIKLLQKEKEEQVKQRNLIIVSILFLSLVALFFINRQRVKLKFQQQLDLQDKKRIEQEMQSAKEQLEMFTHSIVEKTNLIEQLEQQLQHKSVSIADQELISSLSQQTILTEADWDRFKNLFEKIYPYFFQRLKTKANDITMAEQRMAALIRLQLTTKQTAATLGISVDSVHKTRQRLRKRFNLSADANLEEYIAEV